MPIGDVPEHAEQSFVAMADGARLATDIYLPPGSRGRRATVLIRLPYDKDGDHAWIPEVAARLVDEGYAVVAQDVRGKARSEGVTHAFVAEVADGAATLDWIERQRWSDGSVGMWGQSYYGFTQWAAASTGHRALRCIVPQVTATDIGGEWMYRDGVFDLQTMAEWAAWAWVEPRMLVHHVDWTVLPVASLVERWSDRRSESYDAWMRHGPRSSYWSRMLPLGWRRRVRAAVLGVGAFWDAFPRGQLRDVRAIRRAAPGVPVRLEIGARDHLGTDWTPPGTPSRDFETDPALRDEALTRYLGPAPGWYRVWLGRGEEGVDRPPVAFEVAGEGWRHDDAWPPAGGRRTRWSIDAAGWLTARPARRRNVRLPYDPRDPVPTLEGNPWQVLHHAPDRSVLLERGDVVSFDTEPLEAPLVLAGPAVVSVEAAARGGAATLHAHLVDVWPNGVARRLASGAARLSRSRAPSRVDLGHACCRLEAGRVLRLELASSDFPRHPRPAGTASALTAEDLRPGEVFVALGGDAALTVTTVPGSPAQLT
ncbi:MAG TPA: CocE/NonD family hydrolase [Actinomycetota bacterium]|nr:CocE/NonD family hydrolase [Actinomycetota bacterium]